MYTLFSHNVLKMFKLSEEKGGEGHLPEHGLASFTNTSPLFVFFEASFKYSGKKHIVRLEDSCCVAHFALFPSSLYMIFLSKNLSSVLLLINCVILCKFPVSLWSAVESKVDLIYSLRSDEEQDWDGQRKPRLNHLTPLSPQARLLRSCLRSHIYRRMMTDAYLTFKALNELICWKFLTYSDKQKPIINYSFYYFIVAIIMK